MGKKRAGAKDARASPSRVAQLLPNEAQSAFPETPERTEIKRKDPRSCGTPGAPGASPIREEPIEQTTPNGGGAATSDGAHFAARLEAVASGNAVASDGRCDSPPPADSMENPADRWPVGRVGWWAPGLAECTSWEAEAAAMEGAKRVLVLAPAEEKDQDDGRTRAEGWVRISDGSGATFARAADLEDYDDSDLDEAAAARLFSHAVASPSPRCTAQSAQSEAAAWAWLTPAGLGDAASGSLILAQSAVPHLIGRGGRGVRRMEQKLGVIIGIMDSNKKGGFATVTVLGPAPRVEYAKVVIGWISKGMHSLIDRLPPFA